jgi:ketosteroid isomerase-like protein
VSQSNVEIVRRAYEALGARGVDAVLEFIDPDFESEAPSELAVEPQTYRGHEGVKRWFESFYEAVDEVRIEPEEFIDAGGQVVVPVRLAVRGHDSGIEVAQRLVQVWTLRDGLAVRMDAYADKDAALRAVGGRYER